MISSVTGSAAKHAILVAPEKHCSGPTLHIPPTWVALRDPHQSHKLQESIKQ